MRLAKTHLAVMPKFEVFRSSQVTTNCDECDGRVDLLKGGVCERCRRILCYRHLHGSWLQRFVADLRGSTLCVRCRHEPPERTS